MTFNLNTTTQIQTATTKLKMILWSKVFKGDKNCTFNQKQLLVSRDGSGVDLLSFCCISVKRKKPKSFSCRGIKFVVMSFPFVFLQECSQLLIMCSNYGWLKFIVDNVWTLISSMIKTSLINQYLGSKIDWHELWFSVLSSVHPWAEMLRLTGPAIKKKGQHTLRLCQTALWILTVMVCLFETQKT